MECGAETWPLDRVWLTMYLTMDFQYGNRDSFSWSCRVQTVRSDSLLDDLRFMLVVNSFQRNLVLSYAHPNKEVLFFNCIHKVIQILLR